MAYKKIGRRRNPGAAQVKAAGMNALQAIAGAASGLAVQYGLGKVSQLSPGQKAGVQLGLGLLAGGAVAMKAPVLGAAIAASNATLGGGALVTLYRVRGLALGQGAAPASPPAQIPAPAQQPAATGTSGARAPGGMIYAVRTPARG